MIKDEQIHFLQRRQLLLRTKESTGTTPTRGPIGMYSSYPTANTLTTGVRLPNAVGAETDMPSDTHAESGQFDVLLRHDPPSTLETAAGAAATTAAPAAALASAGSTFVQSSFQNISSGGSGIHQRTGRTRSDRHVGGGIADALACLRLAPLRGDGRREVEPAAATAFCRCNVRSLDAMPMFCFCRQCRSSVRCLGA